MGDDVVGHRVRDVAPGDLADHTALVVMANATGALLVHRTPGKVACERAREVAVFALGELLVVAQVAAVCNILASVGGHNKKTTPG